MGIAIWILKRLRSVSTKATRISPLLPSSLEEKRPVPCRLGPCKVLLGYLRPERTAPSGFAAFWMSLRFFDSFMTELMECYKLEDSKALDVRPFPLITWRIRYYTLRYWRKILRLSKQHRNWRLVGYGRTWLQGRKLQKTRTGTISWRMKSFFQCWIGSDNFSFSVRLYLDFITWTSLTGWDPTSL